MGNKKTLTAILDWVPFRWFLALCALFGFAWLIYSNFIRENAPKFEYEIISDVSIFNSAEDISSIKILIDDIDVQKNNTNISIFTIKILNDGSQHINYNSYDNCDFGLAVQGGYVIEQPTIIDASTDHIKLRYKQLATKKDSLFLHMPYLALDVNDYYIVKFGIFHHNDSIPLFTSIGKISGQKKIEINDIRNIKLTRWSQATLGDYIVQIIRFLFYGIILIIVLLCIFYFFLEYIPEKQAKRKRKQFLKDIVKQNLIDNKIIKDYIDKGAYYILKMHRILESTELDINKKYKKSLNYTKSSNRIDLNNSEHVRMHESRLEEIEDLIKKGCILVDENDVLSVESRMKKSVDRLCKQLKDNDMIGLYGDFKYFNLDTDTMLCLDDEDI